MQTSPPIPNEEERIWAAVGHFAAPAPVFSFIMPLILWAIYKNKSRYVAFHALQAAGLQLLMAVVAFGGFGCYAISFFAIFTTRPSTDEAAVGMGVVSLLLMVLLELGLCLYSLVMAVLAFRGQWARIPILGAWALREMETSKAA